MDSGEMMESNDNVRCIPAANLEESERNFSKLFPLIILR